MEYEFKKGLKEVSISCSAFSFIMYEFPIVNTYATMAKEIIIQRFNSKKRAIPSNVKATINRANSK